MNEARSEIRPDELDPETRVALELIAGTFARDPENCSVVQEVDDEGRTVYSFATESTDTPA